MTVGQPEDRRPGGAAARRVAGLAMLVMTLLAVVVAVRLSGTKIVGTPIAPPGLSAPNVGDCVASFDDPARAVPPDPRSEPALPPNTAAPAQPPVGVVQETGVRFTACEGEHLGEVVAYRRMAQQRTTDTDRTADINWCRSVAADYRAHLRWRVHGIAGGRWIPSTGQRFTVVPSAPFVDPDEPSWSACLLLPPAGETYRGSYLGSLAFGPAPAPFGRCFEEGAQSPASCAAPHSVQEFGTSAGPPAGAREVVTACRELIRAMTGMADATGSGVLRTEVIGGGAADGGATICRLSVVGDRLLIGTLIGIGAAPLPLA